MANNLDIKEIVVNTNAINSGLPTNRQSLAAGSTMASNNKMSIREEIKKLHSNINNLRQKMSIHSKPIISGANGSNENET